MITARLNKLRIAYQQARKLVGEANQGKAIPGVALRWCNKVRKALAAELHKVAILIAPLRLPRESICFDNFSIPERHDDSQTASLFGSRSIT